MLPGQIYTSVYYYEDKYIVVRGKHDRDDDCLEHVREAQICSNILVLKYLTLGIKVSDLMEHEIAPPHSQTSLANLSCLPRTTVCLS